MYFAIMYFKGHLNVHVYVSTGVIIPVCFGMHVHVHVYVHCVGVTAIS